MKSKMKFLINPFERIAGWQALFIGIAVMALTAIVGKINHVAFDGVLDVHAGATFDFKTSFSMQAIDFLVLFLTMWLAGVCFSKSKLRAIDVAGTMALTRAPMLLLTIVCFLPVIPTDLFDIPRMIIFGLICIPFYVWLFVLMYNAYSVSCNLKGRRAVLSFFGALVVAEIVSKFLVIFLLCSMFTNTPKNDIGTINLTANTVVAVEVLTIRQKTENVVNAFERGDFDAITVYFDDTMKTKLSSNMLQMTWVQINFTFGKFEKADMDGLKETRIDNYDVIEAPMIFAKEKRTLRLVFNSEGKISGLFII